jgi:hypothetical protein
VSDYLRYVEHINLMGKFIKTVFGGNGIVSNVVDLVKVPQMTEQRKVEINELKVQLQHVMAELEKVSEEQTTSTTVHLHTLYTHKEEEITQLQSNLTKLINVKVEYGDIFDLGVNQHIDAQIETLQNNIYECQKELYNITSEYQLHIQEVETKRKLLENTKLDVSNKLTFAENKLIELQDKMKRKKNQLDNNFDKLF